jgi:hypothetical protein
VNGSLESALHHGCLLLDLGVRERKAPATVECGKTEDKMTRRTFPILVSEVAGKPCPESRWVQPQQDAKQCFPTSAYLSWLE